MRSLIAPLPFIALAFLCWGNYGPLMREGQDAMGHSHLRPFICVGVAYFFIAVVVPVIFLITRGEEGGWTIPGLFWSLLAGTLGAVGAFGIIMAIENRGSPVYVMPLVFGCAPVVNTFVTMFMSRTFRDAKMLFFVCVGLVALGAVGVLVSKPSQAPNVQIIEDETNPDKPIEISRNRTSWRADNREDLQTNPDLKEAYELYKKNKKLQVSEVFWVFLSIVVTALCWGSYGPILHKGQAKMLGSRLRPFLCVGFAYFAVAVVLPLLVLSVRPEESVWTSTGILWSLAAGAAGAFGALGIIMAFNFGGKPIFVMPLVFGMAPIVNTITTITSKSLWNQVGPPFFGSLVVVILGAVGVLIFSPKGPPPKKKAAEPKSKAVWKPKEATKNDRKDTESKTKPESEAAQDASPEK